jgi:integrase
MASNIASKERKAVAIVSVGSVAIPIYAAPVTLKKAHPATDAKLMQKGDAVVEVKTYQSFQIAHYEGNQRILQRRRTLESARALAREIATRLNREGARANYVNEKDRRVLILAQLAVQPMGMEVDEVCRTFMELQKRVKNGTLQQAVDFFNAHGQRIRHGATGKEIFPEYIAHLEKRGVGHYHMRDTKRYIGNFTEACPGPISQIETAQIDAFLATLGGKCRNKNNHRKAIIAFFNFAVEKGFLPHGLPHAASSTTEYSDAREKITSEAQALDLLKPDDIYSPDEMRRILAAVDDDALRATLEIKAFSGVRTEEITRLWWVMVAEVEECIRVPDAVGKISARRVPILPNLKARLAGYKTKMKKGRVAANWALANSLYHSWQRATEKAGVPYKRNGLRNSYITYRLIITDNINQVAEECGTSPNMIKKNYQSRAAISKATADEWFAI